MKRVFSAMMLVLLITWILMFKSGIQPVKAIGTIYIWSDGRVVPSTAPISTFDEVTYTFTDDIYNTSIVVQRGNITIDGAGHTLQSSGQSGTGFSVSSVDNVTIKNTKIMGFDDGVSISSSSNGTISANNITNNYYGIYLSSSSNSVSGNNIVNSDYGIYLESSSSNTIYHNSFINNTNQVDSSYVTNVWDEGYPSGGNYWSDYADVDLHSGPGQNVTGSDGIGDTPYVIDSSNWDNFPLMGEFHDFSVTSEQHVQSICNSSISDFQFDGTVISFNVAGETGTDGFCRICIPTSIMNTPYKVLVNGAEVPYDLLLCSNSTYSYLYFTYLQSTQETITIAPPSINQHTDPPQTSHAVKQ